MNWLRRLLTPQVFVSYIDLPPDFWTPEDRASWLHFRGSPAGRKLGVILNNQVTSSAVAATADKVHSAHSCGRACGVRDTVQVLDLLLPEQISPAGAQPGNLDGSASQDAADSLAHLAP